jgi:predicted amidophosphoribosyltransferase
VPTLALCAVCWGEVPFAARYCTHCGRLLMEAAALPLQRSAPGLSAGRVVLYVVGGVLLFPFLILYFALRAVAR